MQTKEMVPRLRFSDFRNDILNTMRFTECCDLKHGFQFRDEHFVSSGIPVIKIANLNYGGDIKLLPKSFVNQDEKFKKFELKQGDVLMALTGGTLGKTCKILENYGSLYQNYRVGKFVSKDNAIDAYIYFVLQSSLVQKRVKSLVNEAAQPNFGKQDFDKIKLALPKIEEQQKIASFLSSVDDKISQLEKKKTLLETYKRGIMQKIFSEELRFKDENGEEFPEIIKSKLDACLISVSSGKSSTKSKSGIYPIYGSTGKISSSEKYEYEGENILIARVGANAGSIYIVNGKYNVTDNTLILSLKKDIDLYYIYFWLTNFNLTRLIFGSGQPLITGKIIKSLVFDFPQISEQQKIASFLSSIDKKIEITSTQLEKTLEFKKGLLQQMFV
jgi:type I restriction enzyme, S subunit